MTLLQIVDTLGLSYGTVNRMRIYISAANLKRLPEDNENFISRLLTHDDSWIYHYNPELKAQNKV